MKAIDLYNEIASGTYRKKVEYESNEFTYDEVHHDYYSRYNGWLFDKLKNLNDGVEIIEDTPKEDNKIEKLSNVTIFGATLTTLRDELQATNKRFENKLNEIIDKINDEDTSKKIEQIGKSYMIRKYQAKNKYDYDMEQVIEMLQDIYEKQSEIIDRVNGRSEENEK